MLFEGDIRQLFTSPNREELEALDAELNELVAANVDLEDGSQEDINTPAPLHSVLSPLTVLRFGVDQVFLAAELAPAALARAQEQAATQEERDQLAEEFAIRIAPTPRALRR